MPGLQPGRIDAMARRFSAPYQSEPVSSLASWARNLAVFSVVAVLVSILIVRFGFLEMKPALATFFGALACAGLSILVGLAAFVAIWQNGSRGMSRILLAMLIDLMVLAYPAYLAYKYRTLPPIHDITTDPINPPRYEALARLRSGDGANTAVYAGLYSAELQHAAYPDIEPVSLDMTAQKAYDDADLNRAVEAYRFFYPTVSGHAIFKGNEKIGIIPNKVSGTLDTQPKHVGFTLNSDTPYAPLLMDLSNGRYLALGLQNEEPRSYDFTIKRTVADYQPNALQRRGVR